MTVPRRHAVLRAALTGLGLGAAWGVAARVWMRVISTSPEFSWSGTLMIIGFSAILGMGVAVSSVARGAKGWRRGLRLAVLPGMVMFAGQGMPLLPAFVLGGALLRRRSVAARVVAALALVAPAVLIWRAERFNEETLNTAPLRVQIGLLIGMPLLATALALAGDRVWGPLRESAQSPSPERARSSRRSDSSLEAPAGPA
jgi:hypothetical protein